MSEAEFRQPRTSELADVAGLRWRWLAEEGDPATVERAVFQHAFIAWAQDAQAHRCVVAIRDHKLIGMAWLALIRRVPTPQVLDRTVGDVQSVYIIPEERDGGIGGHLIDAILTLADELGLERVTVHSTTRAIPVYLRAGFTGSRRLLQFEPELPPELRPPGH